MEKITSALVKNLYRSPPDSHKGQNGHDIIPACKIAYGVLLQARQNVAHFVR